MRYLASTGQTQGPVTATQAVSAALPVLVLGGTVILLLVLLYAGGR